MCLNWREQGQRVSQLTGGGAACVSTDWRRGSVYLNWLEEGQRVSQLTGGGKACISTDCRRGSVYLNSLEEGQRVSQLTGGGAACISTDWSRDSVYLNWLEEGPDDAADPAECDPGHEFPEAGLGQFRWWLSGGVRSVPCVTSIFTPTITVGVPSPLPSVVAHHLTLGKGIQWKYTCKFNQRCLKCYVC